VWWVSVELSRPIAAVWRVVVNNVTATWVDFLGSRQVMFSVPDAARKRSDTLIPFLQAAVIQIQADVHLRDLGVSSDSSQIVSVSVGFGIAPKISDSMEEGVQRCIRFLLMSKDPLRAGRGAGLLNIKRRGMITEESARRMISDACTQYNAYPHRRRGNSRWTVVRVQPLRVRYSTWSVVEQEWGLVPLSGSDLAGRAIGETQSDERVLTASLKLDVARGELDATVGSAITL
jgi:hypothetical protein